MDKYEYKLRNDEIKSLIKQREFQKAVEIADTIDWTRVRSVTTLCTISDLYKINRRYKDAKILLEQAYDRYPNGRMIVYSLCELCIKMEEIVQAIEYYKQFVQMAPTDNGKFILQYKIYEAQEVSIEERIAVLEELKKRDYKEKWGYELAYLYHRIGLSTKCVEECDELIVWFREGAYVKKAMELKMLHQQLTDSQMSLYENMLPPKERQEFIAQNTAEIKKESDPEDDIMVKTMDISKYNTINLQKELAESMKDVLVADNGFAPLVSDETGNSQPGTYIPDDFSVDKKVGTTTENMSRTLVKADFFAPGVSESPLPSAELNDSDNILRDTGEMEEIFFEEQSEERIPEAVPVQVEEEEPNPAPMNIAPYDPVRDLELTMAYNPNNLPSELQEENNGDIDEEAVEEAEIPKVGTDTGELFNINDTVEIVEPIEATKVFNRDELHAVAKAYNSSLHAEKYEFDFNDPSIKQPHEDLSDYIKEDIGSRNKEELLALIDQRVKEALEKALDMNRPMMVQPVVAATATTVNRTDRLPYSMENVLSQDSDGQISLVVPDAPVIEKQITGQMSIEDILNEWEKTKRQNQAKFEQSFANKVIQETGNLFTQEEVRQLDGILEKLERDESDAETERAYEKYLEEIMAAEAASEVKPETKEEITSVEISESDFATGADEKTELVFGEESETEAEATVIVEPEAETEATVVEEPEAETEATAAEEPEAETEATAAEEPEAETEATAEEEPDSEAETDEVEELEEEPQVDEAAEETYDKGNDKADSSEDDSEKSEKSEDTEKTKVVDAADDESDSEKYSDSVNRSMNEDELALFGQFAQTKSARQNLLHSLDKISLAAYTGNVFVTGETTDESLDLAKNVIRYIKNTDGNFTGKIAKVSGEALNNKSVSVMVEKLASGGLIIEKASGMSAETTKNLLKSLNQEKTGIVVALQDTKKNMHKMMEYFDGMKQIFNVHIEVEELSDDALVAYGKKYAEHLEYSIDDMGILALHTRIDELQTSDHIVTVADVRNIMDEAIEKANKKSLKHFTDVLFAKRYDDEDMIILRENDFIS